MPPLWNIYWVPFLNILELISFSLAVTDDGTTHCMGRREYGRLGMGDLDHDIKKPTPIESLVGQKAISASAGECVSLVVMESGRFLEIPFFFHYCI